MTDFAPGPRLVVEAFAGSLGLPAVPARDGSYSFAFARSGLLTLTAAPDGRTLVSLARQPARPGRDTEARALAAARPDPTTGRFLHAGLAADGSLVFVLALEPAEFDLPALDACLQQLVAVQDEVS